MVLLQLAALMLLLVAGWYLAPWRKQNASVETGTEAEGQPSDGLPEDALLWGPFWAYPEEAVVIEEEIYSLLEKRQEEARLWL